jgi:hypothetical protein
MSEPVTRAVLFALLATPTLVRAQDPGGEVVVDVTVTSVSGRDVYLDSGQNVGLAPGTRVELFAPGALQVFAEVRAVTQTSARAELPPGITPPPVGTRGQARVTRPAADDPTRTTRPENRPETRPPHPGWTRQEPPRDPEQPLLVPSLRRPPEQRDATLRGRLFAAGQWNRDLGGDEDRDYLLWRTGVRADANNLLSRNERVRFAGELVGRSIDGTSDADENLNGRLDLFSIAFGTEHEEPLGLELGRFLSPHVPELGLVDGAEVVARFTHGVRLGGGGGAFPRPFPARDAGEDLGVYAFADYTSDERRTFAAMLAAQKTWHEGSPDRDLVLLRLEWRPAPAWSVLTSGRFDVYTSQDRIKGSGIEVTEAMGHARWNGDGIGAGVFGSRFTWPELKRREYQDLPLELVQDGFVERLGGDAWWRPIDAVRVSADVAEWRDQDRRGTGYGAQLDWRSVFGDATGLQFAGFENSGSFTAGPGARATLRGPVGGGFWRFGYRWHRYELTALATGPERFVRQSVEAGLGLPLGDRCDLDLTAERWFGDDQDAFAVSVYLQWRL